MRANKISASKFPWSGWKATRVEEIKKERRREKVSVNNGQNVHLNQKKRQRKSVLTMDQINIKKKVLLVPSLFTTILGGWVGEGIENKANW